MPGCAVLTVEGVSDPSSNRRQQALLGAPGASQESRCPRGAKGYGAVP